MGNAAVHGVCVGEMKDGKVTSLVFFFKQKTAYEIGTGDWSSDVCSSDLGLCFARSTHRKIDIAYAL